MCHQIANSTKIKKKQHARQIPPYKIQWKKPRLVIKIGTIARGDGVDGGHLPASREAGDDVNFSLVHDLQANVH